MKWLAALLVTGCVDYAHVAIHDAPANIELAEPIPFENGAPAKPNPVLETGSTSVAIVAAPYALAGLGRDRGTMTVESGVELRYEQAHDAPMELENWGITAGIAINQSSATSSKTPGALYLEGGYRFMALGPLPFDVSAGPVVYVDNHNVGGQLTARWLIFMIRTRYVANTGWEAFTGAEIPIPFLFGRSR